MPQQPKSNSSTPIQRLLVLLMVILLSNSVGHAQDTLIFKNGDLLIGEFKEFSYGRIDFNPDNFGRTSIEFNKIASIHSQRTFFLVYSDGKRYEVRLVGVDPLGLMEVEIDRERFFLPVKEIVSIDQTNETFWSRVDGKVSVGLNYTKSTEVIQSSFSGQVSFQSRSIESFITFNSNTSSGANSDRSINQSATYNITKILARKWNVYAVGSLERNTSLGLDLRRSVYAAGGYNFVQNSLFRFRFGAGFELNKESYTDETADQSNREVLTDLLLRFSSPSAPEIDFTVSQKTHGSLTIKNRYRTALNADLRWEVLKDFDIGLTYFLNFDSKPQAEGAIKLDYGVVSSLAYSF